MAAFLLLDCGAWRAQAPQTQKTSQSSPSDLTQVSIENLMNLEQLPARGATVIALPMKIAGGSGGPLRIIALVGK